MFGHNFYGFVACFIRNVVSIATIMLFFTKNKLHNAKKESSHHDFLRFPRTNRKQTVFFCSFSLSLPLSIDYILITRYECEATRSYTQRKLTGVKEAHELYRLCLIFFLASPSSLLSTPIIYWLYMRSWFRFLRPHIFVVHNAFFPSSSITTYVTYIFLLCGNLILVIYCFSLERQKNLTTAHRIKNYLVSEKQLHWWKK